MTKTVLFTIETSGPGGAEKMLISLADSLDRARFRPVVCLLRPGWLLDQLRARGLTTHVVPLARTADPAWVRSMRTLLRDEQVAVMHAHEFYMNSYCALLSRLTGVPSVTTVHGRNYSGDKWYRRAAYRAVARNSRMIAVSDGIADFLEQSVGVPRRRQTIIRNGIDCQAFAASDRVRAEVRAELGLLAHQPVIGCLGNLYPVKGHTHLIDAAAVVCRRFPDAVFLFAGRGQLLDSLQRQAAALGIAGNMRFLGFREDSARLLSAMDIFAMPSLSEGLPLSILEAMAAERAIVASAVGGIPEVIVDGSQGLLVPAGDHGALARAILSHLDDRPRAAAMSAAARAKVVADFSLATMTGTYERLYSELIATRQRAAASA
jgi:glycosyltransferase involved in cell wall biosynthesis